MTFDVSWKNVKDADTLMFDGDDWKPQSWYVATATMFVGLNEITENNWEEFFSRLDQFEVATGIAMRRVAENNELVDLRITPDIIKAHIGLHTNAPRLTPAAFRKKLTDAMQDASSRRLRNWKANGFMEGRPI